MHIPYSSQLGIASALMASIVLLTAAVPARGNDYDSVILMPRDSAPFTIDKASLPHDENDTPELVIVSWSPPSRGSLTETPTSFKYSPDNPFRFMGSDSFRYRFVTKEGIATATVFLVADLGPGDDSGVPFGETTAGGDTVLVLDIGTRWAPDPWQPDQQSPLPATRELVRAIDHNNDVRFDLLLTEHPDGERILQARAYENGADVILLPPASVPEGTAIVRLDWWSSFRGARNGGLLVRYNEVLVSQVIGLDNPFHDGLRWIRQSGAQSTPAATLDILGTHERTAAIPMAFPPGFADNFEDGTLEAWHPAGPVGEFGTRPSGLVVSSDAATDGDFGLRADLSAIGRDASLLDPSPGSAARYRARFDIRIDETCIGAADLQAGQEIVLLAGQDATSVRTVFELGIRVAGAGAFRVTLRAIDDAGLWQTFVQPNPITGKTTLDVEWWAATVPPHANGGLALRINGAKRPWPSFTLTNTRQRIGGMHFGAVSRGSGAFEPEVSGSVCLDELESWF